jgi:hypothetical protein
MALLRDLQTLSQNLWKLNPLILSLFLRRPLPPQVPPHVVNIFAGMRCP